MSSISPLFSHVDWRNKGEVSMVMPVTSSLPEGLGIVLIVLHKRRRKEGHSRRKGACHSSLVICNCAIVHKCLTQSLRLQRKWEQMCTLSLCVRELVAWHTSCNSPYTFLIFVMQHSGKHRRNVWKGGSTIWKVWVSSVTSSGLIRVATCSDEKWHSSSFIDSQLASSGVACDSSRE